VDKNIAQETTFAPYRSQYGITATASPSRAVALRARWWPRRSCPERRCSRKARALYFARALTATELREALAQRPELEIDPPLWMTPACARGWSRRSGP